MGYQSKTYSLSDEVVAAIEAARAAGETPNQFFTKLIRNAESEQREPVGILPHATYDPANPEQTMKPYNSVAPLLKPKERK